MIDFKFDALYSKVFIKSLLKVPGFVVIRVKKIEVGSNINHTPHACVQIWPLGSK